MKKTRLSTLFLSALLFFTIAGNGSAVPLYTNPAPKGQLPILAWYSIPHAHYNLKAFSDLKEAGFNVSLRGSSTLANECKALSLAKEVGIKLIFNTPLLETDGTNTAKLVKDNEALAGYNMSDEPSYSGLSKLTTKAQNILKGDSTHLIYTNLLPYFNSLTSSYGPNGYKGYLMQAISLGVITQISFDFYPITYNYDPTKTEWYKNLEVAKQVSDSTGMPFWAFIEATGHDRITSSGNVKLYPTATLPSLRLQAYTDLGYGAQGLEYFTYWNPVNDGSFAYHDAPVDSDGTPSHVYYLVKQLNTEIQNRAFVFLNSKVLSVRHSAATIPIGTTALNPQKMPQGISSFKKPNGGAAMISDIVNGDNHYFVIVNRDYTKQLVISVGFTYGAYLIGRDGSETYVDKDCSTTIDSGDVAIFHYFPTQPAKILLPTNVNSDQVNVYNLDGVQIRSNIDCNKAIEGLRKGIYIINGRKIKIK